MTHFNKAHWLGKYGESIFSVIFELAKQSAFHPTSTLDHREKKTGGWSC